MAFEVKNISFSYRKKTVLKNVSFSVGEGKICALLGKNGAGKTTLLRIADGILSPESGSVWLKNENITAMKGYRRAKIVSYVAQSFEPGEGTCFEAVLSGRIPHSLSGTTKDDLEKTENALHEMNIAHLSMRKCDELSGGERQKTAMARAFAQDGKLFLLDEPTANLDVASQIESLSRLRKKIKESGAVALCSTHDVNLALRFADEFVLMKDGSVFACGGEEIVTEKNLSAVFGYNLSVVIIDGKKYVFTEVEP